PLPARTSGPSGPEQGTGIVGMAARADQLGGTLSAGPDGAEWRVLAELPLTAGPVTSPETAEDGCVVNRIVDTLVDPAPEVAPSTSRP
ncbi:MAG: hypothetical protein J2O46_10650, partial [Nocardioides sp.]|nr:hypothetical protein [Nocardioides sp.]